MRVIVQTLFDRGGLSAAFEHARNLVVATFIALCLRAMSSPERGACL
jgi:hypothetical protein